ncbi:lysophospholipid acyltransferase family protein [Nocardia sp. NBC_01329]|uniref:lysophospholipid acyltransferase family protein n=1 Tax=Nocardia sp. NBC_01329 TaxID=2903594 RepID=UPI002E13E434|nr:1-acyl-sn-glycerol-3-phosphate acyltransferase [Nocardia sp. NBC_01329]
MSLWSAFCYRLCRYVLIGPVLWLIGRPEVKGREHLPQRGPYIVAANHLAVLDSFYLSRALRTQVFFLAKSDYFDRPGPIGLAQRWFFRGVGQIRVDRRGGPGATPALTAATGIIERGGVWGIHPEGTRSPDGRLYRGHTGVVRVAMATGVPLLPVAITGTGPDPARPWWRRRVVLEILPPLDLTVYRAAGAHGTRRATDALMRTIAARTGQRYVDEYANRRRPDQGLAA